MTCRNSFLSLVVCGILTAAVSAQQSPQPKPKKEKKVWTNDNLDSVRDSSTISVVGQTSSTQDKAQRANGKPEPQTYEKDPRWYRAQLGPLRAQFDSLDKEIRHTKEFLAGGHTGEGNLKFNQFSVPMNPQDQIKQLEKRKADVQTKIDALEDRARRNGIPPGDLR